MAFVRKRETEVGSISTALVEAYRDAEGKPRQRTLANLHGAESTLEALARLAAQRDILREEKAALDPELKDAQEFYEQIMSAAAVGRKHSKVERRDIDRLLRARKKMMRRSEKIAAVLAQIEREGAVVKKHCAASPDEIQAEIQAFQERLNLAEGRALLADAELRTRRRELRRLKLDGEFESLPPEFAKLLKL
jgi:chromosome segregation ATPase